DRPVRLGNLPLADRGRDQAARGAPDRVPVPRLRAGELGPGSGATVSMVGIVVVSHSAGLADGVVALAREMAGPSLRLEAAGGFEQERALGTDAGRVLEAVQQAMSADGVLVLMDLGSALMSAEFAVEMLGDDAGGP